jgi:Flp pilus assembly protein TadG
MRSWTRGGRPALMGHSVRDRGQPIRDQGGSIIVEIVVITPVLFVLVLILVMFGRVSEAHQQVVEAARAGAEAAAVLPTSESAQSGGPEAAAIAVFGQTHTCVHAQITADVSKFQPGGSVSVTVVCQVDLSDLSIPGVPGSTTVQATAVAPIDPYRSVSW